METDQTNTLSAKRGRSSRLPWRGVSITQDRIARSLDIIKQTIAKLNRCSHAEPITVQTDRRRFRDFARSSRANASEVFRLSSTASACEEPEREASRCLVRAAVLVCVRDDLMPDASCQGNRCPSFSGLPAIMLQCAHTEADGLAPCKGDHIHDDRCSDRH